eukprot:TRINITY_DN2826_c0_g1_i1.p1 TRINITY_DN2826_c0_g1~~TRINITY_DN2826_c0_g1_i1.p1  ORF type:complete len:1128 (+),score=197.64 TRINITY_DN2826_c0_g1_i1:40-3423(+)
MVKSETLYLKPTADGILRLTETTSAPIPSSKPAPPVAVAASPKRNPATRTKSSQQTLEVATPPAPRFWETLLQQDWTQRLANKPTAVPKLRPAEEQWFIPEFDLALRDVTANIFIKLCGCGLAAEAAAVLQEYPTWDLNAINDVGDTALHAACYHGHIDTVIFLLDQPTVKVDFENDAWRPIHIAASRGDVEIVQLLLSRGADPNAAGQAGLTPLHLACLKGHTSVAQELVLNHSACLNNFTVGNRTVHDGHETPLHLAALAGHFACVDLLLGTAGTNVSARTAMGWTALHLASEHGHTDVVELLLWYAKWNLFLGIDINAVNCGWTPLQLACEEGHLEIVCLLLMSGDADPNFKAFGGYAALHLAAAQGHTGVVALLLSRRTVDPDIRTDGGSTALHLACETNRIEVVKLLLQGGADPQLATVTGDTCLHTVADKGFGELWHILTQQGMAAAIPNHSGVTPTELASSKGHAMKRKQKSGSEEKSGSFLRAIEFGDYAAIDEFLSALDSKSVNGVDKDGRTALHMAAETGQFYVFSRLLAIPGINVNAQTYTGNTALHLAAALGHRLMVKRLLDQRDLQLSTLNSGWTPVSLHNMMPDSHIYAAFERKSGLQGVYVHDGREALHAACGAGNALIAKMLLQHPNADVNTRSRGYQTALHLAAERGDAEIVEMLLEFRRDLVDVNAMDGNGSTPLHDACRAGHLAVVNRLLAHPTIDVNIMTTRYHGQRLTHKRCGSGTPLHVACEYGHAGVVRLLLRHPGIDPALPTPWGAATPLHVAAGVGLVEAVELLLTFDAVEINAQQDDGSTAWDAAFNAGQQRVLEVLTPANASAPAPVDRICSTSTLELQDGLIERFNNRPPHAATAAGYPTMVRFQSSGVGYNPSEVSAIGPFNDWNVQTAVPLVPVSDKYLGTTWIAVLELPPGENEVQLVIDGAYGMDNKRKGHLTLEGLDRCNVLVTKPPFLPTVARSLEGTRIKELPGHRVGVFAPLAPPATIPPHEYLDRPSARPLPPSSPSPTKDVSNARQPASLGVEVKFFRDHKEKSRRVAVVVALKPQGPAEAAGIQIDDVIAKIDGHEICNKQILGQIIGDHKPGDILAVALRRNRQESSVLLKLEPARHEPRRPSWVGP